MTAAFEAVALGKRYRRRWGLRDCSFTLPAGKVVALVGPNASGKSTLLRIAAGLVAPTTGRCAVLGEAPGSATVLRRVGYLDQDRALYRWFRVDEMLRFGRAANRRWDTARATTYLSSVGIDLGRKVGSLSGGQQAQVALALCLAKRPDLLLLDEPLASLDPLARQQAMRALMTVVADDGTTLFYSSHVVSELEGICDHLVVLAGARVQLADDIDHLRSTHRTLVGPRRDEPTVPLGAEAVVTSEQAGRMETLLVRGVGPIFDPAWQVSEATLEEIVLAYLASPSSVVPGQLWVVDRKQAPVQGDRVQR